MAKITYEIVDGYVGGRRPQTVEVDDGELGECETADERRELIEDAVQADFENKISWSINDWGGVDLT